MVIKVAGILYPIKWNDVLCVFRRGSDIVLRYKELSRELTMPCVSEEEALIALMDIEKRLGEYKK